MKQKLSQKNQLIQAVCTLLAVSLSTHSTMVEADEKVEKCYGISKKGVNDCAANNHSCQGQSSKAGDPAEWIFVPNGTCNKIVNGSTTPPASKK